MRLGVVHDLAVGVDLSSADAWTLRDVLAPGISVGAPPDMYNQQGQDWNQPPWHPSRLAEAGYAPFRNMLSTVLRHAGGIRVDHVLGLFRLWWVPAGNSPRDGAYVTYDHDALIGILALEAQRAGAVVIGEDLGTFEPWVRDYLAARGILGTSILWFENDGDSPLPPERYRTQALASVNTHDLPPTAGYLAGDHVALRSRLGLLERSEAEERAEHVATLEKMMGLLRERGLLPDARNWKRTGAAARNAPSRRCTACWPRRRRYCSASHWSMLWGSGACRTSRAPPKRCIRTGRFRWGIRPGNRSTSMIFPATPGSTRSWRRCRSHCTSRAVCVALTRSPALGNFPWAGLLYCTEAD